MEPILNLPIDERKLTQMFRFRRFPQAPLVSVIFGRRYSMVNTPPVQPWSTEVTERPKRETFSLPPLANPEAQLWSWFPTLPSMLRNWVFRAVLLPNQ
jgi:hypothetical protein